MAGESGVVIGGSGVGKSNLAGFLGSRPDVINSYTDGKAARYCFLRLDINNLPGLNDRYFYRGLIQLLQETAEALGPEIHRAMTSLAQNPINWNDTFEVLVRLQKAHELLIRQADASIIWLLDRFDMACRDFEAQTLNSLRSLRDRFKGQLCYIVFTRYPLARLRNPREIDEFYEIVVANTCWVGPMVERDARWVARQMAERLDTVLVEPVVAQLIEVTGGLPAFMKSACLALTEGAIDPGQSAQEWVEPLLSRPEFERNCQEIWTDLTPEEQNILAALSAGAAETIVDAAAAAYLEQTGLLARSKPGAKAAIFSPIFETFIKQRGGIAPGRLELDPITGHLTRGGLPLNIELTPYEHNLLSYLVLHPGKMCSKDELTEAVWPDEYQVEGIPDERLAQLIKRLREKIEPDPSNPTHIHTVRGRGYRFMQPET
jgi:DNA-binding response OmpR family regulator